MARIIKDFVRRTPRTVLVCWGLAPREVARYLNAQGIHVFQDPSLALRTLNKVMLAADVRRNSPAAGMTSRSGDWAALLPTVTAGMVVSEHECHRMLSALGLRMASGQLLTSEEQLGEIGHSVGYPVAMKGISPAVTHRAKAGLIALDVRNDGEAQAAWHKLMARARKSGVTLEGVYAQHMHAGRIELLVSAFRDPVFGVMVACGGGGNLTELIDDVVLARAPLSTQEAGALLQSVRTLKQSGMTASGVDAAPMVAFLKQFSEIAQAVPWKRFVLEINPVKWALDGDEKAEVVAVDGLLLIESS